MKEDFLHFLWKFKLFNTLELKTTEGEPLSILKTGLHNHDSGPDFSHSKLKIGDKIWSGNVEIHIKSSDWYNHSHQKDEAYKNVILHVVYENDREVHLTKKGDLPVLELKPIITSGYLQRYEELLNSRGWIPCQSQFPQVIDIKLSQWLDRLVVSRLQRKSADIMRIYFECQKDWNETFYRWISRSFGFKINSEAFEELASKTPLKILKKHANSMFQIEALLFGQAGMLNKEFSEEYPNKLKSEYKFLASKYTLQCLNPIIWKFSKTHPSNFPTVRIAQLAAFISNEKSTFSKILELSDYSEIGELLAAPTTPYWKTHFQLDKTTVTNRTGMIGQSSKENLLINCVATMLFTYGKKAEDEELIERAIHLLEKIPSESNGIITKWKGLGLTVKSSKDSQALIELKNEYCQKKKCLTCLFGTELLSDTK